MSARKSNFVVFFNLIWTSLVRGTKNILHNLFGRRRKIKNSYSVNRRAETEDRFANNHIRGSRQSFTKV